VSIARGLSLLPKAGRSCHAWAKCIRVAPVEARCFCCPDQHAVSQACSEQVGHQGSEDRGGGRRFRCVFFGESEERSLPCTAMPLSEIILTGPHRSRLCCQSVGIPSHRPSCISNFVSVSPEKVLQLWEWQQFRPVSGRTRGQQPRVCPYRN